MSECHELGCGTTDGNHAVNCPEWRPTLKYFSDMARKGGFAKAKAMTKKDRSDHGKKMVQARITKRKQFN